MILAIISSRLDKCDFKLRLGFDNCWEIKVIFKKFHLIVLIKWGKVCINPLEKLAPKNASTIPKQTTTALFLTSIMSIKDKPMLKKE